MAVGRAILACGMLAGCGPQPAGQPVAPVPAEFVSFREQTFMVTELDRGLMPPYAPNSTPHRVRVTSSDPSVVSVNPDGTITAHRNGEASLSSPTGAGLMVTVAAATDIVFVPRRLEVKPGSLTPVRVLVGGREVAPRLATWSSTDPNIAAPLGDMVQAGDRAGSATLEARVGQAIGALQVVVQASPGHVTLAPRSAFIHVGQVQHFTGQSSSGETVAWESSNASVVQSLSGGTFSGRRPGEARVCATSGRSKACAIVQVVR